MAYTYHGTSNLIALPNRTVQTYPSGLVRVEQSFVCRNANAATYRNQLKAGAKMPNDDAPAIDGLYIFPDTAEVARDDGFSEFRVTAYGRTNKTGQRIRGPIGTRTINFTANISNVNLSYDPTDSNSFQTIFNIYKSEYFYDYADAIFRFCVPANEKIQQPTDIRSVGGAFVKDTDIDLFSQSFSAVEIFPILDLGYVPSPTQRISPAFFALPGGFERTNFGSFDEISISYIIQTSSINFGSFFDDASPPAQVIFDSLRSLEDGAFIFLSSPPFSDGVQVKIGNETLRATYGSGARGDTFHIDLRQSAGSRSVRNRLGIVGLSGNTVYQAKIAAFNKNGVGASVTIAFKTGNNFDFAL
jgi:hypothetical protein